MVKKNIVKKKACTATRGQYTAIKPVTSLEKTSLIGSKPSSKPKSGKKYTDYQDYLLTLLQDKEFALGYVNGAIEEVDPRMFLLALKNVLIAQEGGMSEVAKKTKLNRQNLYRMLSSEGNPRWENLKAIFDFLGYKITLERKK